MGYSGDYILAHHPVALSELYVFQDLRNFDVRSHGSRPGGWHTLQVDGGLGDRRDWLAEMVEGSRAPVLIVSFFDGELCAVRGLEPGPGTAPWSVRLHRRVPPDRYPTPKHRHLYPHPLPPQWMIVDDLLSGAPAVEAVAGWSAATGGEADRAGLAALLAEEPEHFTGDLYFRLRDLLGLSDQVELWYPHLFIGWDDPPKLARSIAALQPGRFRALDCREHQNCFALVRMRAEGDYVIEYREPKPEVLHQTTTRSVVKVIAAMQEWVRGEVAWRADFAWTQVSPPPRGRS